MVFYLESAAANSLLTPIKGLELNIKFETGYVSLASGCC